MPERRQRGIPDRPSPDLEPGYSEFERPAFGTHRVCTNCKGKTMKKGKPCLTCGGTGYEKIRSLRRPAP